MKLWLENFHIPPHWNFWNWYMLLKLGLRLFSCWLHVRNTSDYTHQLLIFWKFEKLSDSRNSDQFLNTYTISYIYSWTCLKNHRVYFFSYFAKICNQKKKKGGGGGGGEGGCIYTNSLLESQAIILVYCFIQFVKDAKTLTLALINILMSSKSETKQTLNSSITQNFEIVSLILT